MNKDLGNSILRESIENVKDFLGSEYMNKKDSYLLKLGILVLVLIIGFFLAFLVGKYKISPRTVIDIIISKFTYIDKTFEKNLEMVVLDVHMPRIIASILIGGALSLAGCLYQTLFKNPLVSPDILGVSQGAGFGTALAMLFYGSWWQIQISAFAFGIITVFLTFFISRVFGRSSITVLVIGGVAVSGFFGAFISILKYLADPVDTLPSITFWLMGSLAKVSNKDVITMFFSIVISIFIIFFVRHQINTFATGEEEATTMGVNVPLIKAFVVIAATLLTVSSVSICGIIGWVGLIVPHMARMLVGANFSRLAPISFLIGGIFMLAVDNACRGLGEGEMPLGVLTALTGIPFFVILLSKVKKGWS